MLYIAPRNCSIYSTFYSQQQPSSARVPATHRGRGLHLLASYTEIMPPQVTLARHQHPITFYRLAQHFVKTLLLPGC
jgi:hypothetical protein